MPRKRLQSLWMKPQCVTIQMKAVEQYFHVHSFIMLYKVLLTIKSVDETLVCNTNESYYSILSYGTTYYALYHAIQPIRMQESRCTVFYRSVQFNCITHSLPIWPMYFL